MSAENLSARGFGTASPGRQKCFYYFRGVIRIQGLQQAAVGALSPPRQQLKHQFDGGEINGKSGIAIFPAGTDLTPHDVSCACPRRRGT